MDNCLAKISDVSVSLGAKPVVSSISFQILSGQKTAIVGPMGSGKTSLAKALAGRLFRTGEVFFSCRNPDKRAYVMLVEQQHQFKNRSNLSEFYLQQRFNSSDCEDAYTVEEELAGFEIEDWVSIFELSGLLKRPLIQLSNGENKRLQIVKSLAYQPDWLILDNPYVGLDVNGREILTKGLVSLDSKGIQFILVSSPGDVPDFINQVIELPLSQDTPAKPEPLLRPLDPFETAVKMEKVQIKYGTKTILRDFSWQVNRGERWAIKGPNGAGKSTLISLITADNPQAYSQNIILFDRKRGSGESIWDIKRKIGYLSPELHLYFKEGGSCFSVVASGLFDTLGLFKRLTEEQSDQVNHWMQVMGIAHLKERSFLKISGGEQRMVLITRALVKNPELLILDEPCQGLDRVQTEHLKSVLDYLAEKSDMTLLYVSHYERDIPSCVNQVLELKRL
ncbi:ATP-binding cassette domain-containing protein [Aquirufa antheringensis]|uniref:ATP-binding cassette domain-containing protein n=1 Tax=Aquirufa antheringensis TaxID=2516559 RepID=UPI00208F785C|nr:ATP-binding cassette domain-containing protein [Aquirufa antheringensis]